MAVARTRSIRRRFAASLLLVGSAVMLFGALFPGTTAYAGTPAGSNGTVKIDGEEFDTHPDNQPHVGCGFQVDFYGFDASTGVHLVFDAQAPTGQGETIYSQDGVLDNDDHTGGGSEAGLDGQFTIDLSSVLAGYTPHPQQGYHVRLTVIVDDGDTIGGQVKHKTFWIDGCDDDTTTTTEAPTTTEVPTTTEDVTTTTVTPTTQGILGTDTDRDTTTLATEDTVLGRQITRALPRTGAEDRSMVYLGLAFIFAGLASLVLQRRRLARP